MSCYHPMAFIPDRSNKTDSGTWNYKYFGKYTPDLKKFIDPNIIKVPCGHCIGCRLDYSREWADRMMLELETNEGKGLFVTLTYNDDHVPPVYDCDEFGEIIFDDEGHAIPSVLTLKKRDLQLAFKRLRKSLPVDKKIRYYAVGEYGGHTRRPHYHCIIFGLSLDDFPDRRKVGVNELHQDYFTSADFVRRMWTDPKDEQQIGFVCLSGVTFKTCAYVSRYTFKKVFALDQPEFCEPEFSVMSRRPGIGSDYLKENPDCLDLVSIPLSDNNGHFEVSIPKYYLQKIKLTDKEKFDNMISERRKFANNKELLKLKQTSLSYDELNKLEENSKFNKTKILFKLREEA